VLIKTAAFGLRFLNNEWWLSCLFAQRLSLDYRVLSIKSATLLVEDTPSRRIARIRSISHTYLSVCFLKLCLQNQVLRPFLATGTIYNRPIRCVIKRLSELLTEPRTISFWHALN